MANFGTERNVGHFELYSETFPHIPTKMIWIHNHNKWIPISEESMGNKKRKESERLGQT